MRTSTLSIMVYELLPITEPDIDAANLKRMEAFLSIADGQFIMDNIPRARRWSDVDKWLYDYFSTISS